MTKIMTRLLHFWNMLVKPSSKIKLDNQRRQAQILSMLLMPVILVFAISSQLAPSDEAFFFGVLTFALLGLYALSRTRFNMTAGFITVILMILFMFVGFAEMEDFSKINIKSELKWLSLPLVFGSLCLPFRMILPIVVIAVSSILLFPIFIPEIPHEYIEEPLIFVSFISVMVLFTTRIFGNQQRHIEQEQQKSEDLLLNILPQPIAEQLKESRDVIAHKFENATILFADIAGFTALSAENDASHVVKILNSIFSRFDEIADKYGIEKIKTIGDAYMAAGGIPVERDDHCFAIADMALEMRDAMKELTEKEKQKLDIRIGIHTGAVVAGVIGKKKFIYDVWGDTVNLASRMESLGSPGCIQISDTVASILAEKYKLSEMKKISVKGKGDIETCFLEGKVSG